MNAQDEMLFFGKLVHRGVLARNHAEQLLQAASTKKKSLSDLAVSAGLFTRERLEVLRRVDGHDVPELPGHDVVELAGEGGMAVVVRLRERKSGEDRAVKVLRRELAGDEKQRRAFMQEAKLLISLRHENLVRGDKVGTFDGRMIFLMEYVPGKSLLDLLRSGREFDEDTALFVILQVARALRYLAQQGVVHRDVKPDNVLLTDQDVVKLIDLGFAASGEGEAEDGDTTVGMVAYISPEQARGQGDVDVRSDIYSLGATLYQLVVGELPFQGESSEDMMAAQILESLSSQQLKSRKISPHMHYFIEKMMAKERDVRYQDPDELIADIEEQIRGKKSLEFAPESPAPAEKTAKPAAPAPPVVRRKRRR